MELRDGRREFFHLIKQMLSLAFESSPSEITDFVSDEIQVSVPVRSFHGQTSRKDTPALVRRIGFHSKHGLDRESLRRGVSALVSHLLQPSDAAFLERADFPAKEYC